MKFSAKHELFAQGLFTWGLGILRDRIAKYCSKMVKYRDRNTVEMSVLSQEFEQNIIKMVIGLALLVVGADLISSSWFITAADTYFIPVSIALFVVGIVLIYISVRIFVTILKGMGIHIWKE